MDERVKKAIALGRKKKAAKKKKGTRRRSIVVNEIPQGVDPADYDRSELFCQYRASGLSPLLSATYAQYANPKNNAYRLLKQKGVAERIEELKKENREMSALSRQDVMAGIIDAIMIGRQQADSQAMIRGYNEINKMLGFHAPEKKIMELTAGGRRTVHKIQNMSEADLLQELGGEEAMIIEGEVVEENE